ncbi:anti-sigma-28 factor, FlgM family protein, partial [Vibrio cholerae HC-57A1]
MKRLIYGRG